MTFFVVKLKILIVTRVSLPRLSKSNAKGVTEVRVYLKV